MAISPLPQNVIKSTQDQSIPKVTTSVETVNDVTNIVTTTQGDPNVVGSRPVASDVINKGGFEFNGYNPPMNSPKSARQESPGLDDWRVKLSLSPKSDYLYNEANITESHILFPLKETNGVIFPYTPSINVHYRANYQSQDITHTNYKNHFFVNSSVDEIQITCDFTAQDNLEGRYVLAVIHFFKSVTKMFYGQDLSPRGGTPPPLCFLTGLGAFQFEKHPLVVTSFNYQLPNDVDYIRASNTNFYSAGGIAQMVPPKDNRKLNKFQETMRGVSDFMSKLRLGSNNLNKGGTPSQPSFRSIPYTTASTTYVPTKIQLQITCLPIVSRKNISNNFKLGGNDGYASGIQVAKGYW